MPDPLWRQIAEDLRRRIESGEIGDDGQPLPTEMELREHYRASRNTVRDAIKWLVTRGMVYTQPGRGTFVTQRVDPFITRLAADSGSSVEAENSNFASEVTSQTRKPVVSVRRVEIQRAHGLPAAELVLPDDAGVVSRHQEHLIDGVPYSLQTTFYPMALVERGAARLIRAEEITEGAITYLEHVLGINQAGLRDRITVRTPRAEETAFFRLPDDGRVAVFEITRTGFDEDGQPFCVTVTTYPADRNQFVMTSGNVPDVPSGRGTSPAPG